MVTEKAEKGTAYFVAWGLLVVAATVAFAFLAHDTAAAAWRTTGGVLEGFGLLRGAVSVDEKLAKVRGTPRFGERVRRRFRDAWHCVLSWLGLTEKVSSERTISLEAEAVGTSGVDARLSVRPADDAEVRRWIEYLDGEVKALRSRVQKVQRRHQERLDEVHEKLTETRKELREADREVESLVERVTVGGFQWELVALGWFLAGVVVSTWARYLPSPLSLLP